MDHGDDIVRHRYARIKVDGDMLRYDANDGEVGCFIMSQPLNTESNSYFEMKILDTGVAGCISIGLTPFDYPLDAQPGWNFGSIAYHADDGRMYKSSGRGAPFGPRCKIGDRIGCGIRRVDPPDQNYMFNGVLGPLPGLGMDSVQVYFTRNGDEIGQSTMVVPDDVDRLHPAIGMHSEGEIVQITVRPDHAFETQLVPSSADDFMLVDGADDEWLKTHDVRINGQVIEYSGNGVHIHDVGLAQAKSPLSTTTHYFEIEILEPGQHCYIAIGLVHKNYPLHRHPGWNVGSIAYHADDGKIFLGRGQGTPFGPRCVRGDIMGCGIQFPFEYASPSDGEDDDEDLLEEGEKVAQALEARSPMPDANELLIDLLDDLDGQIIDPLRDDDEDELDGSDDDEDLLWPGVAGLDVLPPVQRPRGAVDPPMAFPGMVGFARGNFERWLDDHDQRLYRRGRGGLPGARAARSIYGRKGKSTLVKVFFTRNGRRIGHKEAMLPKGGFYPAIGMLSSREKVRVDLRPLTG